MKFKIIFVIFLSFLTLTAQANNSPRICLKFELKTLGGKQVLQSVCDVTQKLTYQDSSAKWVCSINGKPGLINDIFSPAALGYDYDKSSSFVSYIYERHNSPLTAILKRIGLMPANSYTSASPNRIFFGRFGPSTSDSVLFLTTAVQKYEVKLTLAPKYLSTIDKCN